MRAITAGVLVLCVAAPTFAGSITGRVSVPAVRSVEASFRPYAGRASNLPAPARVSRGVVSDVVVYLDSAPADDSLAASTKRPSLPGRVQ